MRMRAITVRVSATLLIVMIANLAACVDGPERSSPTTSPVPSTQTGFPAATAEDHVSPVAPTASVNSAPTVVSTHTPIPRLVKWVGEMNRIVYQASDGAIYTVNPDGTDRRRVSGQEGSQAHAVNVWPAWSPDSGTITFSAMSLVEGKASEPSLRRGNAMGGNEPVLLHVDALTSNGINPGTPHYVLWAPNGERLALIADAGQGIVTFSMDAYTGLDVRGNYEGAPCLRVLVG